MLELPAQPGLDIAPLAAALRDRTNSYKFYFLSSILEAINQPGAPRELELSQLAKDMVLLAWYPRVFCNLSFGTQDKLAPLVDTLKSEITTSGPIPKFPNVSQLAPASVKALSELLRYVPTRLIRPWFPGLPEKNVDKTIEQLSRKRFESARPLYRLEGATLTLHPVWVDYLKSNLAIVRAWLLWNLAAYLQSRNPNAPGILCKLEPPIERNALTKQTAFWRSVLQQPSAQFQCIYTRAALDDFTLDHFVPWSFVGHDQLWNLVPASQSVNSSKGNKLPPPECLDGFIQFQFDGLNVAARILPEKLWIRETESYFADLKMPQNFLSSRPDFERAYRSTLEPLLSLANRSGFLYWNRDSAYFKV